MENNYYTPKIEDFYIGYQCEWLSDPVNTIWIPFLMTLPFHINVTLEHIRTPYLTKEQIEAEGWKIYQTKEPYSYNKADYQLWIREDNIIHITKGQRPIMVNVIYRGKCPSINEFRKICKLLQI